METFVHIEPMRIDEQQQSTNERCLEHEEFVHIEIENSFDKDMTELVVTQDKKKLLGAETEDDFVHIESAEVQETTEVYIVPMRIDEQQQSINESSLELEEFVHIENSYDGNVSELVVITQDKNKLLEAETDDILCVKAQFRQETSENEFVFIDTDEFVLTYADDFILVDSVSNEVQPEAQSHPELVITQETNNYNTEQ